MAPDRRRAHGMLDAIERVSGRVPYAIDVTVPDMLHAAILRSQSPHGRIVRIDVERARKMPGVRAVVTGAEIAARGDLETRFGPVFRDRPILAVDKVRFVGEPVAAIAALDRDAALAAAQAIEIEYEDLPAVFDAVDALEEAAPLVHERPAELGSTFRDIIVGDRTGNVCNSFRLRKGDVGQGFTDSAHVFEDEFTSPAIQHVPLETHACVAQFEPGRLTVWAGTQIPFGLRAQLAEIFHLPASAVRVIVPALGGGYGAKCYPSIEPIAATLSLLTRRPVRLHLSREEEFVTITKHAARIRMRTGVREDGSIVARKVTAWFNTGAYADIGPRLIKNGGYATAGPSPIPHVHIDSYAVYTNVPPAGAFRGYGVNQAAWAYESQLDMIAAALGIDPLALRLRNLLREGDEFATGEPVQDCHFAELTTRVAERIGWHEQRAPAVARRARGKGLGCIIKGTVTPSTSTAIARLNDDCSLQIASSSVEIGQGIKTALALIAADRLGLPLERIAVAAVDTDATPYDQQTSSSRSTHAMGTALERALDEIEQQLRLRAGPLLDAAPADLVLGDGQITPSGGGVGVSLQDVLSSSGGGNLVGHGRFDSSGGLDPETGQGIASVHWHQAACAAEVEVDLDTGRVEVLRCEAAVYAGRVINPVQVELQMEGNVTFGVSQALYEELVYDHGQLQNGSLADYLITSFRDMPRVGVTVLEGDRDAEVHGVGETGLPAVMPAIANAVFDATGARIKDLPLSAEKVLEALQSLPQQGRRDEIEVTVP